MFIWILLLFGVALGIAIIDSGASRPIDWTKTYNTRDKIPFGLHVLHQELPQILGNERTYRDFGDTFYEELNRLDSAKNYDVALIEVADFIGFQEQELSSILDFVSQGGELFLSARFFGVYLLDTLGLHQEMLDYQRFSPTSERVYYTLGGDTSKVKLSKQIDFQIFSKLNPQNTTILGHLHSRGRALPNFVQVQVGKGSIYLHTLPEAFGNYYLLQEHGYAYAAKTLNVIQNKSVMFSDTYYDYVQPRTPLRVILSKPGFYQAWYLLLIGLLALLLFKSKRQQRAVKVIKPEPNLSKEFAETIANMYYENGTPGNIIHKKIDYFLFTIRSLFQLDTMELLEERFIKQLSSKAGVGVEETKHLMHALEKYRKTKHHQIEDVKIVNNLIEDYKFKAKIS